MSARVIETTTFNRDTHAAESMITRKYHVGDTKYSVHFPEAPMIHDFQNAGDTDMRFVTAELLD